MSYAPEVPASPSTLRPLEIGIDSQSAPTVGSVAAPGLRFGVQRRGSYVTDTWAAAGYLSA
ncbi:MAG: hypothetical protein ACRDP8_10050 [Actinopolymorphaceae bacterium]